MKGQIFDLDLDWTKTNRYQLELTATEGYKNMKFSKKHLLLLKRQKKKAVLSTRSDHILASDVGVGGAELLS